VFSQIIYDSFFLKRLKEGKYHKDEVDFSSMVPTGKNIGDLAQVEIIFQRKVTECKNYAEPLKPLDKYWTEL